MQDPLLNRPNPGMNNNNVPQPGMPGAGGAGANNVPPAPAQSRNIQQIQADFPQALLDVQHAIDLLSQPSQQAVTTKLNATQKQLQHFSQDNMVKQLNELATNLKASIKEIIDNEQHKNAVIAQLTALFALYQEFAIARLNEIKDADPSEAENNDFIANRGFVTADGQPFGNSHDLGTKHGFIKATDPNALAWKEILVEFKNGVYSSNSPEDLARIVKLKGCTKFTFTHASSGRQLRLAMRAMLKLGIKDVSIDPKVSGYLYRTMLNPLEHLRLQQLERICDASRSASHDMGKNDIFKGDTATPYSGPNTLIEHEIATFQRLPDPMDQLAYLQILYPEDAARKYAEFTAKLEKHGINPPCGIEVDPTTGQPLIDPQTNQPKLKGPRDYFREKLLNRGAMTSRGLPSFPRHKLKTNYEHEYLKIKHFSAATRNDLSSDAAIANLDAERRAAIILEIIDNYGSLDPSEAPIVISLLKDSLARLTADLPPDQKADMNNRLKQYFRNLSATHSLHGCNSDQHRFLKPLRDAIKSTFPDTAEQLKTRLLFKQYYHSGVYAPGATVKAGRLNDRIAAYADEMAKANFIGLRKLKEKFGEEVADLQLANDPELEQILDNLNAGDPNKIALIQIIRDLQPQQGNGHDFDDLGDNDFEMDDMRLPGLIPVN